MKRALLSLIRGYQYVVAGRPSPCRYIPSCSAYAHEAVEVHDVRGGEWLEARIPGEERPPRGHGPRDDPFA